MVVFIMSQIFLINRPFTDIISGTQGTEEWEERQQSKNSTTKTIIGDMS